MLKINLLDWRRERRERRKQQFIVGIAGALAATVAGVVIGLLAVNGKISNQAERNQMLRTEILAVEKQIKEIEALEKVRDNLIARMQVIEQLQQSRAQIVHYFDQIVSTIPEGVYLTSLRQSGNQTTLDGVAESNGRISTYMKNLDASDWFDDPRLIIIKTKEGGKRRLSEFSLQVTQVAPAQQQPGAEVAAP